MVCFSRLALKRAGQTDYLRGDVRRTVARELRLGRVVRKRRKLHTKDAMIRHCLRAVSPPSLYLSRFILRTSHDASREVPCFHHRPDV